MSKIFIALKNPSEEIRKLAMQTLVEIARQEYDSVEFYFDQILEATAYIARVDEQSVGAQAVEFWTSLAEEEIRRKKIKQGNQDYIPKRYSDLISLLLDCIQRIPIEDEEDDSDEWGVYRSAGCCFDKVA